MKLSTYFTIRGYLTELVKSAFCRVNSMERNSILSEKVQLDEKPDSKKLFLILDYNPSLPPLKEWIEKLWPILYKSSATRLLVDRIPIIGYRRPKNLQDLLVSSDLPEINWFGKKKYSIPRCNRSACRHCPRIDKFGFVESTSTGRKYRTQIRISCTSSIYARNSMLVKQRTKF